MKGFRYLSTVFSIWAVGAVFTALAFFVLPGTAWRNWDFPIPSRLGLLGEELILQAWFLSVVLLPFVQSATRSRTIRVFRWMSGSLLSLVVILTVASWLLFHSTRTFLDHFGITRFLADPGLMPPPHRPSIPD